MYLGKVGLDSNQNAHLGLGFKPLLHGITACDTILALLDQLVVKTLRGTCSAVRPEMAETTYTSLLGSYVLLRNQLFILKAWAAIK